MSVSSVLGSVYIPSELAYGAALTAFVENIDSAGQTTMKLQCPEGVPYTKRIGAAFCALGDATVTYNNKAIATPTDGSYYDIQGVYYPLVRGQTAPITATTATVTSDNVIITTTLSIPPPLTYLSMCVVTTDNSAVCRGADQTLTIPNKVTTGVVTIPHTPISYTKLPVSSIQAYIVYPTSLLSLADIPAPSHCGKKQ